MRRPGRSGCSRNCGEASSSSGFYPTCNAVERFITTGAKAPAASGARTVTPFEVVTSQITGGTGSSASKDEHVPRRFPNPKKRRNKLTMAETLELFIGPSPRRGSSFESNEQRHTACITHRQDLLAVHPDAWATLQYGLNVSP